MSPPKKSLCVVLTIIALNKNVQNYLLHKCHSISSTDSSFVITLQAYESLLFYVFLDVTEHVCNCSGFCGSLHFSLSMIRSIMAILLKIET